MKLSAFFSGLAAASIICLLSACSTKLTYENEEWWVSAIGDDADVVVRYVGVVSDSTNLSERAELARMLQEFATDTQPDDPYTPRMYNASRKVYADNDQLIVQESGKMANPLLWWAQTGLNPVSWFSPSPINLTQSDLYTAKSDFDEKQVILETNGRLTDRDTYAMLRTTIRNPQDISTPDYSTLERAEVIYWPVAARTFYWKLSGPGYKKHWMSLVPDYFSLPARPADDTVPADPAAGSAAGQEPADSSPESGQDE